jgi:hypothetical protein
MFLPFKQQAYNHLAQGSGNDLHSGLTRGRRGQNAQREPIPTQK